MATSNPLITGPADDKEVRQQVHSLEVGEGASKTDELLYHGYPRSVWIGMCVGSITFFVLNNIFTFLMMGYSTGPAIGLIPILVDVLFIIPAFFISRIGLRETLKLDVGGQPEDWNTWYLVFLSAVFYMGLLWGLQSIFKQAVFATPRCQDIDGQTKEQYDQACSWARHSGQFYLHALTGPIVLITGSFNFMKFSRGLVFPLSAHIWMGRIHNVVLLIAGLGAMLLGFVSATAWYIKAGFYLLLVFWVPTMLMGWWHIRNKNIPQHKRWMTRNYSLTCCAITLRMYNVLSLGNTPYYLMVYLSFIHPVLLEIYLQRTDDCDIKWWKEKLSG